LLPERKRRDVKLRKKKTLLKKIIKKTRRKKLVLKRLFSKRIVLLASLLVAAFAIGGGLIAYFTDTETSNLNKLDAATFDLKLDGQDDPNVPVYINVADVVPGSNNLSSPATVNVQNVGTVAGAAYLEIVNVVNAPGTTPDNEPTPDNGELGNATTLTVKDGATVIATGTVNSLPGTSYELGAIAASGSKALTVTYEVPTSAGNEINDDSVTFGVRVTLNQIP